MKFFPTFAAAITALGVGALVVSSLAHASAAGDWFFNVAAICMVAGPLIFFTHVIAGLWLEFASINRTFEIRRTIFAQPLAPALWPALDQSIPEGLRRERKGPLNPSTGRRNHMG
jgi:ABC-type multidrug transport system fused ATPase/permease subunit